MQPTYTVVRDSNHRTFLKEVGYGFIAEFWCHPQTRELAVLPWNKGCELTRDQLVRLVRKHGGHFAY